MRSFLLVLTLAGLSQAQSSTSTFYGGNEVPLTASEIRALRVAIRELQLGKPTLSSTPFYFKGASINNFGRGIDADQYAVVFSSDMTTAWQLSVATDGALVTTSTSAVAALRSFMTYGAKPYDYRMSVDADRAIDLRTTTLAAFFGDLFLRDTASKIWRVSLDDKYGTYRTSNMGAF